MRRTGLTRTQAASALVVALVIVIGTVYFVIPRTVTSPPPPGSAAASETVSASLGVSSSSLFTQTTSQSSKATSSSVSGISHVIVILMENEEYSSVIGNSEAPYQNSLASTYAIAANYYGVAHPSLPNYLALIAGSTFGVTSDCLPSQCTQPSGVETIASLLDSHGLTWKEYAESMQTNCSQVDSPDGLYWTKHNPFVYFESVTGNNGTGATSAYCNSHVVPLTQFSTDLQSGNLPNYAFITPNICNDAHSCPLSTGDSWLAGFIPKIINASAFSTTAVFIVYDEGASSDTTNGGGQVACIVVSPFAKAHYTSQVEYTHYSLLATVEEIFHLGSLGRNDTSASPMNDMFSGGLTQNP